MDLLITTAINTHKHMSLSGDRMVRMPGRVTYSTVVRVQNPSWVDAHEMPLYGINMIKMRPLYTTMLSLVSVL